MTQQVFFAHANGFPSATYAKLFAALAPNYQVQYLPQHGHDPRFPVGDNWGQLVEELLHYLDALGQPVWGVGHSLGGILHYHAALLRPELYLGVVMLDSPLLTWADQLVIHAAKRFGFIDRLTPAGRTLGRRETFTDRDEAHRYFASKSLFRRFDPDCLAAYISAGLQRCDAGLCLQFDAATEISIYRSVPHTSPGRAQQLQVPLAMVRGLSSRVVRPYHGRLVRQLPRGEYLTSPGSHMFPLEHPLATAGLLNALLARWDLCHSEEESA